MPNSRRIQTLSATVANQIAAGEVIERPASVIKELVENSLDAGATHIDIFLEEGGKEKIRIRDDGEGIRSEDLPLAVASHATSKLTTLNDLDTMATLGFRGEALASIASVSQLTIMTKQEGDDHGWQLTSEATEFAENHLISPCAHDKGTTVEVDTLFYNTPARRRFLRRAQTELHHCLDTIKQLALCRFDVGFRVATPFRTLLDCPPALNEQEKLRRIGTVFSSQALAHVIKVDCAATGMTLTGWISKPCVARSQTDQQCLILNGRVMRDRLLTHAVRQAYQSVFDEARHPMYVLSLSIDPNEVDINVHPTKHEVRFQNSRLVHDFIVTRVSELLLEHVATQSNATISESLQLIKDLPIAEQSLNRVSPHVIDNKYLVCAMAEGLRIIDIPAAEQALRDVDYRQQLDKQDVVTRPILVPVKMPVDDMTREKITTHQNRFKNWGFDLKLSGDVLHVLTIPSAFEASDCQSLVMSLLRALPMSIDSTFDVASALHDVPTFSNDTLADVATLPDRLQRLIDSQYFQDHKQVWIDKLTSEIALWLA